MEWCALPDPPAGPRRPVIPGWLSGRVPAVLGRSCGGGPLMLGRVFGGVPVIPERPSGGARFPPGKEHRAGAHASRRNNTNSEITHSTTAVPAKTKSP